jgi:AraC-like DNA-binding protein
MARARPSQGASLHAVVLWPFGEALRRLGIEPPDPSTLFGDVAPLSARLPHVQAQALLEWAVQASGREDLGILAAETVEPGHFDLVELASRSGRSVGEGIATLGSLVSILHEGLAVKLIRAPEVSRVRIVLEGLTIHPAGYDFIVALLVVSARRETRLADLTPSFVKLPYAARGSAPPPLARLLACPIELGADALEIGFPTPFLDVPLSRANAPMSEVLHKAARELLQPSGGSESELIARVRARLRDGLASGAAGASAIARKLHMSERTLRRKLDAEGVGLRELLDEERKALALAKLDDSALSTDELAAQLGFTTPQALHRAFRRWTGTTLQGYRRARK